MTSPHPGSGASSTGAAEYARSVDAEDFSWSELVTRAYAADPVIVRALKARPELLSSHPARRRGDQIAAVLLLVAAPFVACVVAAVGAVNAEAFGYYAAAAAVLLFATLTYVLLGWRKPAGLSRRELIFAMTAAAFGVVGAVISVIASFAGGATALNWARPLAVLFLAVTIVAIAWILAVRRRVRAMRDDQPVATSYAVLGELRSMDAGQRAAAADDLRDALAILDERAIAPDRPAVIRELAHGG